MFLGRVMGSATATVKHPSMEGWKLLLVMALQADGRTIEGDPILVVDSLGAGKGELVMITSDGIGARRAAPQPELARPLVRVGNLRRMNELSVNIERVVREVLAEMGLLQAEGGQPKADGDGQGPNAASAVPGPASPAPLPVPGDLVDRCPRGDDDRGGRPARWRAAAGGFAGGDRHAGGPRRVAPPRHRAGVRRRVQRALGNRRAGRPGDAWAPTSIRRRWRPDWPARAPPWSLWRWTA